MRDEIEPAVPQAPWKPDITIVASDIGVSLIMEGGQRVHAQGDGLDLHGELLGWQYELDGRVSAICVLTDDGRRVEVRAPITSH